MHLADELLEHLLGHGEVGDHAVLHRANDGNGPRRLAEHILGPLANGLNNSPELSFTKEEISAAIEALGLPAAIRGEALTLEQFAALADELGK